MPSPFPGMDPYLEDPGLWPDVHHGIISESQAQLNRLVGPKYVVRVEERVYIADDDDSEHPFRFPDLRVAEKPGRSGKPTTEEEVTMAAKPLTLTTIDNEEVAEARLEVIDREGYEVVTVIEVVSPSNKKLGSEGRASYLKKRKEVLLSNCHWVEIDLHRAGTPVFRHRRVKTPYFVHVSPADLRPKGHVWPIVLREPLPAITIPLRKKDGEVALDLQQVLNSAYDRAAYDRTIDYNREPVPPLSADDAAWADALLREKGLRK